MSYEHRLNINGEFLGVTSMAAYSAPWFLQLPLLMLVGALFVAKVTQESRRYRRELADEDEGEDYLELLNSLNRMFFGFRVAKRQLPAYWISSLIYLITLVYAVVIFCQNL